MAQTTNLHTFIGGLNKTHQAIMANNMVFGTVTESAVPRLPSPTPKAPSIRSMRVPQNRPGHGRRGLVVANIAKGDKVVITGPVTGTSETAKTISDRSMNAAIFLPEPSPARAVR